jgi:hypothetical protein
MVTSIFQHENKKYSLLFLLFPFLSRRNSVIIKSGREAFFPIRRAEGVP